MVLRSRISVSSVAKGEEPLNSVNLRPPKETSLVKAVLEISNLKDNVLLGEWKG